MKNRRTIKVSLRRAAVLSLLGIVLAGCATKSGYTVGPKVDVPVWGQIKWRPILPSNQ